MKRNSNPASVFRARRMSSAIGLWAARLCAILALCAGIAQAGPYDTWAKYKTLTINTTASGGGASVSGTVTNFPVLVRLTTATAEDILAEALANGADVRFASSDGSTALSYQIERWSSTAAEVWVLVPSIAGNSTTNFRVYWNKSGQSDASSGSSVFSNSNGFVGVWHLGETGNSTADGYKDATGTAAHAQGTNFGSGNQATSVAGIGQTFANASSRKITVKAGVESDFDITSAITVSAWINVQSWSPLWQAIITKGDGAWRLARNNGAGNLNFSCTGLTTNTSISGGTTLTTGGSTWYYVAGVYDGSNLRLYLNGGSDVGAVGATGSISTNNYSVVLGENGEATARYFDGKIDEARVENVARSADWIKLTYWTQVSGATAIMYGSTQANTFYWNRNDVLTSSTDVSKAYNWTMNADGTGRRAQSSDDDDFTTTSQDAAWTCQDADAGAGGTCSQSTRYGRLSLAGFGADVYGTTNEFTVLRRSDITGDFDVTVRVDSIYNVHSQGKAGIFMADDFTSLGSGGYAGITLTAASKIEMLASTATAGQMNYSDFTAGSVTPPVWLRLVKNGSSVSGYYRTSLSSAWTQQGTTQTVIGTDANSQIGLLLCSHNAGLASVGVFDEFQAGMPISSSTLDLSFAGTGSNADAAAAMTANLTAASIDFTGYTGNFGFGSRTLTIGSGNATFGNGMSITTGTGTLAFTGTSGTQILTPPSGITLPAISSTGAATLQLSTNALNCQSYSQSAGTLDFNGVDAVIVDDFTLTSGTSSSFANLTGRSLTVGGSAGFTGQSGNLVNLNVGAWTLTVTGALTADYANIGGSNASGGSQGTATHSFNGRNNTNWLFSVPATLSNLTRSVRLNFNTTSSGANVPGNVTNIPIFLRFTSSNLTFSATSESGSDLIFVDKDGTTLYHQVVEWDKANQTGKAWVKVPQVDGNSATDYVTLYYGCDSCTTNAYALSNSVWSDYAAAYHLSGGENKAYDATANAYNGTFQQNQAMITGMTTKLAPVFNGTTDYITTTCPSNVGTRTLAAWIYPRSSDDVAGMETVIDGDVTTQYGSGFGLDNGKIVVMLDNEWWSPNRAITLNAWQHVMVRFNATKAVLFLNGTATDSVTYTQGAITSTTYVIGKSIPNGYYFDGYLNDVSVADSYRSTDYIKLFYESQKTGSTLLTAYTTASFQSSKIFKLNTTPSGADVTGNVTNFPLLLRIPGVTALAANNTGTTVPTDIRFLDGDGVTWLDYQIERWDRTGGIDSGEVWVRVPTVEGNYAGHTITMYYKQAASVTGTMADGQCASCVFQTSNSFVADWHFNTSGTGARPDATGNALSLTTNGYSGSEFKGGVIAGADSLNGTTQYLNAPSGFADWSTGLTYTGWAWWSSTGTYARLFDFGNGTAADNIYSGRSGTTTNSLAEIYNVATSGGLKTTTGTITTGVWGHFAVTVTGTTIKMYKNGNLEGTFTSSQSIRNVTRTNNYLGKSNWAADAYYQGKFDEVAIANTVRDSNWIKLAYQNQRRDATPLFNPSPAEFQSTRKFTFNTTKTGANVGGDVADFPMLVRLTGLTALGVNGSGTTAPTDIRFLDGDGKTWLNYQVERWDRTGGIDSAEVWVLVPQVDGNSDHDFITMYYKTAGGTIADGQCATCVFSTSNSHTGVWHLSEETAGTGTASVYKDATGNAHNGTDMISATGRVGVVGWGHQFDATDDYINLVAGNTLMPNTSTPITLSAWFNTGTFLAGGSRIFGMPKSDSTTALGLATVSSGGNRLDAFLNGSSNKGYTTLSTSTWYHSALSWDGTTFRLYVNGTQDSSYVSVMAAATAATARIGIRTRDNFLPFDGYLDEVRFSQAARSADWIKLEYENQRRTGNLFWNSRVGPNNNAVLTATATSSSNIALSWGSAVTDSTNADSVGIWVGYSAPPDSANIAGATLVTRLAKTDTVYSYPATYSTTYYFALAIRNTSGKWSPFTSASTDTVTLVGATLPDTIYVDSARGLPGNSCASARSPATPKQTITDALTCGASATDTLVIRVMPGTFASDYDFAVTSSKPSVVTSFDNTTRAILAGNGSVSENGLTWYYAVALYSNMILRNMDVRANATSNTHSGIYVHANADYIDIIGNRVYGISSYAFDTSVTVGANNNEGVLIANNLLYKPNKYGVRLATDDNTNVMHNVFIGPGTGTTKGIYMAATTWDAGWFNITNNIFYNWTAGIETVDADNEVGNVSNNLFFLVTSGSEVVKETDANKIIKDPLFANTNIGNPNAFKPLPGSPAIDAGTATRLNTGFYAYNRFATADYYGSTRTLGTTPDIGLYEGSGYTPNPSGEFDTLQVSSTATTATVQNSKWKLVWDKARGAGITGFYDKISDPSAASNLVYTNSLLFDAKIGAYTASSQTGAGPLLYLVESTRARAVIRQNLPVSASIDLNIYYTVYPSGHVYVESELSNLSAGSTAVTTVDYTLRLGSTSSAFTSADSTRGFGYLTTASRDALLAVTRNLDGGASGTERWSVATAASGTPGTVVFKTTDMADLSQNTSRRHDFLLYLGETALDFEKSAALNTDAYAPSALSMSTGSLLMERSWQDVLEGHWSLDDGAGATARDKSVFVQNNATLGGANYKWVSGKVNGGLSLTTTDSAYVPSTAVLNPANGFTVMFWLKPDFTGMGDTALIVSKGLSNASGWYFRKVANASGTNKILFNMGGTTVTSTSLTDLAWSHIAVVADSGGNRNLEMYVNGVQVAASAATPTATSNALNLVMGYASGSIGGAKFKGTLDDVRVYLRQTAGPEIQSIYNRGFSSRYGHYALRADNNNRIVALINGDTAKTRLQPAFVIANWYGPRTPKFVYLNGVRLTPNVDFVSDTLTNNAAVYSGSFLALQLNKVITGAAQTLFIDDDDSTGFMGTASAMKALTITSTASDRIRIKNFTDTVFGGAASGQWYMELGLKGWTTPTGTASSTLDSGFGEIMTWKAAAVSPSVAISSAYQMAGYSFKSGRVLSSMKLDARTNEIFTSGRGYLSPAALTYTLVDSSSTRLSLTLSAISLSGTAGTATVVKRFTFYPTGRVFISNVVSSQTGDFDTPRLDLSAGYNGGNPTAAWPAAFAATNARVAWLGGDLNFHPIGMALLGVKNVTSAYTTGAAMVSSVTGSTQTGASEQSLLSFNMPASLWTSANKPITVNYMMDFSKKFTDSATADSLLKDSQNPAVLTAISGSRVTTDALDFNVDNFAEGDGAYTYAAASGIAHFKFANAVTSFNPAFRISAWTYGVLPEFVIVDNQVLVKGYHYNAYLNTATNEVILQLNKTLAPGTHVIFISHKSGLAVTLRAFTATGGEGVDSLAWTTESEFENLGFHVWRRLAQGEPRIDGDLAKDGQAAGDAATATVGKVGAPAGDSGNVADTLPSLHLTEPELQALGYVRITPRILPGAKGGSSASTRDYLFLDRTAEFGAAYEYLLEAVDFNGGKVQYGPRLARPLNPLNTELYSNYPNPFNPVTTLRFSLKDKLKVSLVIYDAKGRMVRNLIRNDKAMQPGKYRLVWDAKNEGGFEVPSGQYFYRFTAGRYVKTRKMILVK